MAFGDDVAQVSPFPTFGFNKSRCCLNTFYIPCTCFAKIATQSTREREI